MSFGRRTTTPAWTGPTGQIGRAPGTPEPAAEGPVTARRGGYWLGLLATGLAFPVNAVVMILLFERGDHTALGVLMIALPGILGIMMVAAIPFVLVDLLLRRFRLTAAWAYGVACGLAAWAPICWMSPKMWVIALPPAIVGGLVMSRFRRRA